MYNFHEVFLFCARSMVDEIFETFQESNPVENEPLVDTLPVGFEEMCASVLLSPSTHELPVKYIGSASLIEIESALGET